MQVFEKHVRGAALSIAGKVGIDQLLYAPFSTAIFFAWANIAAGTAGNISNDLSSKLVPSVKAAWALWVPAMLVNMALIPPDMRILWISATAIVWTIVLSGMASEPEVVAPLVTDVYDVASLSSLAALLAQDAPAKRGSGSVRRTSRDVARTASGGRIPSLLQLLRSKLIAAAVRTPQSCSVVLRCVAGSALCLDQPVSYSPLSSSFSSVSVSVDAGRLLVLCAKLS